MPVGRDSQFKTISAVLTKDQVRRLEALRSLRGTPIREAGFSEALREAVDAGLQAILRAPSSSFDTRIEETERVA